jgi:hypothetical protein
VAGTYVRASKVESQAERGKLMGDMNCPRGIMHTDVRGISHTDFAGDVPVGPARIFGNMETPLAR